MIGDSIGPLTAFAYSTRTYYDLEIENCVSCVIACTNATLLGVLHSVDWRLSRQTRRAKSVTRCVHPLQCVFLQPPQSVDSDEQPRAPPYPQMGPVQLRTGTMFWTAARESRSATGLGTSMRLCSWV